MLAPFLLNSPDLFSNMPHSQRLVIFFFFFGNAVGPARPSHLCMRSQPAVTSPKNKDASSHSHSFSVEGGCPGDHLPARCRDSVCLTRPRAGNAQLLVVHVCDKPSCVWTTTFHSAPLHPPDLTHTPTPCLSLENAGVDQHVPLWKGTLVTSKVMNLYADCCPFSD